MANGTIENTHKCHIQQGESKERPVAPSSQWCFEEIFSYDKNDENIFDEVEVYVSSIKNSRHCGKLIKEQRKCE